MNEINGNYPKIQKLDTKEYMLQGYMFWSSRKCKINLWLGQSEQQMALGEVQGFPGKETWGNIPGCSKCPVSWQRWWSHGISIFQIAQICTCSIYIYIYF
jgi:hypothetical protein